VVGGVIGFADRVGADADVATVQFSRNAAADV
jgi:hypothetical protein